MPTAARAGACSTLLALSACGPSPGPPPRPPRPPRTLPPRPREDAGAEGARVPAAAVPEAVARCVERARSATPGALRGALELLDEPTLLDSACRLELAPRLRAPDLCLGASLSSLREVCLRRAAMTAGLPERCPALGRGVLRDPVCVAIASRDLGLCAAAGAWDRVRCEALADGAVARCGRLDPLLRTGCEREVLAMRGLLPAVRARSDAATRPSAATLSCGSDGGVWSIAEAQRGVVLEEGGAWALLPSSGRWPAAWSVGSDAPVVALRAAVAGMRAGLTVDAEAVLELPRLRSMRSDDGTLRARVTLGSIPRRRGDRVRAEVALSGLSTGVALRCTLRLDAFVRDVVPPGAIGQHPRDGSVD